jgi:hypothetical protein
MFKRQQRFEEWSGAPQMETGAPTPAIRAKEGTLTLAYRTQSDEFAVIRFEGVHQHTFGYPNDEALGRHPLYSPEIHLYAFNEVLDSPYLQELDRRNAVSFPDRRAGFTELKHWLIAFHDETLEIISGTPRLWGTVAASDSSEALSRYDA